MPSKTCTICNETKDLSEFPKTGARCKRCLAIRWKAWYEKNKERINARERARYAKNRDSVLARNKKRYIEKHDEINEKQRVYRIKNRDVLRKRAIEWSRKHPIRYWINQTLKDHSKKGIDVKISRMDLLNSEMDFKRCNICGRELNWNTGHKGRILKNSPSLDRTDNEDFIDMNNIQVLCVQCNCTKSDRTMSQFVEYCKMVVNKFEVTDVDVQSIS